MSCQVRRPDPCRPVTSPPARSVASTGPRHANRGLTRKSAMAAPAGSPVVWADEIRPPATSSLRSRDNPATEERDAAVAIEFDGWEVVR
jgi:hypothetical protein